MFKQKKKVIGFSLLMAVILILSTYIPYQKSFADSNTVNTDKNEVLTSLSDEELLNKSIQYREGMGFNSDIDYIKSIMDNPSNMESVQEHGVPLTSVELAEIKRRVNLQSKISDIRDLIGEYFSEGATIFTDHENGGILKIGLKDHIEKFPSLKEDILKLVDENYVEFYQVKSFTESELIQIQKEMREEIKPFRDQGIVISLSPNIITEKIEIGLSEINNQTEINNQIKSQFSTKIDPQIIEFVEEGVANTAIGEIQEDEDTLISPMNFYSRDSYRGSLEGGLKIYRGTGTGYCSSAFMLQQSGASYLITAAHCGTVGQSWTQVNHLTGSRVNIGSIEKSYGRTGGYSDIAAIRVSTGTVTPNMYEYNPSDRGFTSIINLGGDNVGDYVCKSGARTGVTCGNITNTSYDITYDGSGHTYYGMRRGKFLVDSGDSGGIVYQRLSGSSSKIYGVISGKQRVLLTDYGIWSPATATVDMGLSWGNAVLR